MLRLRVARVALEQRAHHLRGVVAAQAHVARGGSGGARRVGGHVLPGQTLQRNAELRRDAVRDRRAFGAHLVERRVMHGTHEEAPELGGVDPIRKQALHPLAR